LNGLALTVRTARRGRHAAYLWIKQPTLWTTG
jgi:hypothetical protein